MQGKILKGFKVFLLGFALFQIPYGNNGYGYEEFLRLKGIKHQNLMEKKLKDSSQRTIELIGKMTVKDALNNIADAFGLSLKVNSDAINDINKEYFFNIKGDLDKTLYIIQKMADLWVFYNPMDKTIEVKKYRWFTVENAPEGVTIFSMQGGSSISQGGSGGGGGGGEGGESGGASGIQGTGSTGLSYKVQNVSMESFVSQLEGLNIKILAFQEGILKFQATPSQYETIRNIFNTLKKYRTVILGKVSIIRVDLNNGNKWGINWDMIINKLKWGGIKHAQISVNLQPFGNEEKPFQVALLNGEGQTRALLKMLQQYGDAKLVNTWIFSGKTGTLIPFGSFNEEPYVTFQVVETDNRIRYIPKVKYKYAGFFGNIYVTKQNHKYYVEVALNLSDIAGYFTFKNSDVTETIPKIQSNQLKVSTYLPQIDNVSLLLTGFKLKTVKNAENKVPYLGDIPVIGNLFKQWDRVKSSSEFIVIITLKKFSRDYIIQNGEEYQKTLRKGYKVERKLDRNIKNEENEKGYEEIMSF
jgi:hypothetical protein